MEAVVLSLPLLIGLIGVALLFDFLNGLHDEGLKDLFRRHGASNSMAYIIGSEIYGELEKVVDRFEDVVNEISGILIENV